VPKSQPPQPYERGSDYMNKKVIVAMSGGVDSSLAALLLKQQDYRVEGVTLNLWEGQADSVCDDARTVAEKIGIKHHFLDVRSLFHDRVIDNFCKEYSHGRTPNPCVICNEAVKFGVLLQWAMEQGADYLASGHYARIFFDDSTQRYQLLRASDTNKDQSYMLWRLRQDQLQHILFPVGEFTKDEIRNKAASFGISVADKPDSQEICFIPGNNYREFLKQYQNEIVESGVICSTDGVELGTHAGISNFTVGQRKNLGIAAGHPLYVVKIDAERNRVIVGKRHECLQSCMLLNDVNFVSVAWAGLDMRVQARIRYNMKDADAVLSQVDPDSYQLCFDMPQWAVTPGQSAVFYQDQVLIGGGVITG
jgi:tRNA-uridine 2-sulfurtransferase